MTNRSWAIVPTFCLVLAGASADAFRDRMTDAADLCAAGDHEAAVAACKALAAERSDPEEKFQALSTAARCARLHLRSETRALELCDLLEEEPYRLGCRAVVYQWMTSPARVLEDLGDVDLTAWPEPLAATAFLVRGQAHYSVRHGQEAVNDFVRAYQFCGGREKWGALQRLGDTFRNLMDDEILAEACYRKAMKDGGMAWSGLQARVNLGDLLIEQQRYDDALAVFRARPDGSWRVEMLLGAARVHQATGAHEAALSTLAEALKVPGIQSGQRAFAEKMQAELAVADGSPPE